VEEGITWVGLDAHKAAINVAMFLPGSTKPIEWQLANEPGSVRRMVRKIERRAPGEVRFCYEAGRVATACRGRSSTPAKM